jgi:uncharacterized protein with PIN domain
VIIDVSALVAIIRNEPDAATFAAALEGADWARISAANHFEPGSSLMAVEIRF